MSQLALGLTGFGSLHAGLGAIAALRKSLPDWVPADTPGHFLKHADEQTVVAVAAVDRAIRAVGCGAEVFRNWPIIAAPQFVGRLSGTAMLVRYARSGGSSISPHLIPQHSLHSISGALSILLGSQQPNLGVGGAAGSLAESLLAAVSFPVASAPGVLLVATAFEPEPQIDQAGQCTNSPACSALAMVLQRTAAQPQGGEIRLKSSAADPREAREPATRPQGPTLPEVIAGLQQLEHKGGECAFQWRLTPALTVVLHARQAAQRLAAA